MTISGNMDIYVKGLMEYNKGNILFIMEEIMFSGSNCLRNPEREDKKMKKKLIAAVLAAVMTISLFPASVFANADIGTPYPVIGGNIYCDENAIVGADYETVTTANIPPSIGGSAVTKIYEYGFSWCTELKKVTFPDTVKTIGTAAFNCCLGLESITIPGSITFIGVGAFFHCSALKTVTMSKSVKRIETDAFAQCSSLTDVYYGGTEEEWNNINGKDELSGVTIHFNCDIPKTFTDPDTGVSVDVFEKDAASSAEFVVEELDPSEAGIEDVIEDAVLYNIYFKSGSAEVQPEKPVTVSLPVPEGMSGRRCNVFRVDQEGSKTDMNAEYEYGYLIFAADHFSLYLIEKTEGGYKTGDVNDDGAVNAQDKAILNRYLAGWDGYKAKILNMEAADIDGKDGVNAKDKAILNRYLAGWNGYNEYFE